MIPFYFIGGFFILVGGLTIYHRKDFEDFAKNYGKPWPNKPWWLPAEDARKNAWMKPLGESGGIRRMTVFMGTVAMATGTFIVLAAAFAKLPIK